MWYFGFTVCKLDFCSSRRRNTFYTTFQVLCAWLWELILCKHSVTSTITLLLQIIVSSILFPVCNLIHAPGHHHSPVGRARCFRLNLGGGGASNFIWGFQTNNQPITWSNQCRIVLVVQTCSQLVTPQNNRYDLITLIASSTPDSICFHSYICP